MNTKDSTHCIRFHLSLSKEKYLAYYQGRARNVLVRSEDNRNIEFPASAIRRFLTHDGIYGLFEIHFDENNKLIDINQINA